MKSKYLAFQKVFNFKGKTKKYNIVSKSKGHFLGQILWHCAWRQYTFSPSSSTVWNKDCLKDIQEFLQQLMDERKIQKDKDNFTGIYSTDGVDK